jgi:hypothetical protein
MSQRMEAKRDRNTIMEKTFEIGDFVKYRKHRGQIIDILDPYNCPYTGAPEPGFITIIGEDGHIHSEYHYVFELDREKIREDKLKELGII